MTPREAIDTIIRSRQWPRAQILALLAEREEFRVPPAEVEPYAVEAVEAGSRFPLNYVRGRIGMAPSPYRLEAALASMDDPVVGAIRQLDLSDPKLWTKGGAPRVEAIESVLGRDITSAERDAAWSKIA